MNFIDIECLLFTVTTVVNKNACTIILYAEFIENQGDFFYPLIIYA